MNLRTLLPLALCAATSALAQKAPANAAPQTPLLTGQAAFTDWNQQHPGVRHKITTADLPAPTTPFPSRPPASPSPSTPAATPHPSSAPPRANT